MEHLSFIGISARDAVASGDGTLKEANDTYQTLAGKKKNKYNKKNQNINCY